jgi:hypothetical protein
MLILVRLEIVLILTQVWCMFALNIPQAQKLFWTHPIELIGDVGHLESHFGWLGDCISIGAR